jgi:hypothetical protein
MAMALRRRPNVVAYLMCVMAVVTSAALFTAAALVPAPPAVLPLVLAVCIGGPMLAAWELRSMFSAGRRPGPAPLDSRAVARLRRHLDELPETQHPLGF